MYKRSGIPKAYRGHQLISNVNRDWRYNYCGFYEFIKHYIDKRD
jgi:hypothetical protein